MTEAAVSFAGNLTDNPEVGLPRFDGQGWWLVRLLA
jgi:hypothetical protein